LTRRVAAAITATVTVMTLAVATDGAGAAVSATSGQVQKISPPSSVLFGALESNETMVTFDEQQDVVLAAPLLVNFTEPGTYDETTDLQNAEIPAGTLISSHFVHGDKVGDNPTKVVFDATVTTDRDILGVMVQKFALDASDHLGAPGTLYPTDASGRQLELNADDFVIEQVDRRTIVIHSEVDSAVEHVRIITAGKPADPDPDPDPERGCGEGCSPGYWKQPHHFDSWVGYQPNQLFADVFGVNPFAPKNLTLVEVLSQGGGGAKALARQAVASLLNGSALINFPLAPDQVIEGFQKVVATKSPMVIGIAKFLLEWLNTQRCTLN
jgi:hypothetical protein